MRILLRMGTHQAQMQKTEKGSKKRKERREWETSLDTIKEYTEEEKERRRKWEEQRQYF